MQQELAARHDSPGCDLRRALWEGQSVGQSRGASIVPAEAGGDENRLKRVQIPAQPGQTLAARVTWAGQGQDFDVFSGKTRVQQLLDECGVGLLRRVESSWIPSLLR